jgi:hypothetical protein
MTNKEISDYLIIFFNRVYCDSCKNKNNENVCDECHRKNMNWGLSEQVAIDIAEVIGG